MRSAQQNDLKYKNILTFNKKINNFLKTQVHLHFQTLSFTRGVVRAWRQENFFMVVLSKNSGLTQNTSTELFMGSILKKILTITSLTIF